MQQGEAAVLVPILGILVSVLTWFWNEKQKRVYEEYKRKERMYSHLIGSLKGFYVDSRDKDLKEEFLAQLRLGWMYCPDDVIRKAYVFWRRCIPTRNTLPRKKHGLLAT